MELLVTVTIIALLVMLFIPNMRGMLRKARTVQCANRLREIGKAVAMSRSEKNPQESGLSTSAETWPNDVWPFIEPRYDALICPEDAEPHAGRTSYMDVLRLHVVRMGWYNEFDENSPWMVRLSQTQYDAAGLEAGKELVAPAYVPDQTPHIYWWGMEDWHIESGDRGSDKDYEDIRIKVTELPDGTIRMDFVVGTAALTQVNLVDEDDKILWTRKQMKGNEPFYWGILMRGLRTSYGMNVNIPLLEGATGKILALDYEKIVADSFADIWGPMPEFARHEGQINVLGMDGSVNLRRPQEIDPAEASVEKARWQP